MTSQKTLEKSKQKPRYTRDELRWQVEQMLNSMLQLKRDFVDSDVREFDERITEATGHIESIKREL